MTNTQTAPTPKSGLWKFVFQKTLREFSAHQSTDAAAALTYYAVLSMFPALIAVFSLLGVVGQSGAAAKAVLGIVGDVAPGGTADALRGPIEQVSQAPSAGFALVAGILVALWSASGYVGAFGRAMNRIYEVDEGRPIWKLRPTLLLVTVITVVALAIVAASLVLSGRVVDAVGNAIHAGDGVRLAWNIAKWPVLLVILFILVAVLYYATPNVKPAKFRLISLGSVLAVVVVGIGTLGFGIYVANFSNYNKTYGSLAGIIVFLLWLWIANLALLLGAEFDAELERKRQLQRGMPAERDIQLPPRDTRQSDKRAAKASNDIDEARRIRREHAAAASADE